MSTNRNRKLITGGSGGMFAPLANRAKLIGRLMMDGRVNPFLKFLPVAALVYLLVPDLPGPVDDTLVMWLGLYLFVELCPPDVVEEHLQNFESPLAKSSTGDPAHDGDNALDGEFSEIDRVDKS